MTDTDLSAQMQEVRHKQQLSEAQVNQALQGIVSSLQALQVEQREITREIKAISNLSGDVGRMGEEARQLHVQIVEQNNRMESYFTDQDSRIDARFNRWESERDSWRTRHEGDNRIGFEQTETKRVELEGKVGTLRENQRYAAGWVKGLAVVGGLLMGAMVLIFNDRFQGVQNGFADVRSTGQTNRRLIDEQMSTSRKSDEDLRSKVHEIELFLARGGERRLGPYNPPQQQPEKTDGR